MFAAPPFKTKLPRSLVGKSTRFRRSSPNLRISNRNFQTSLAEPRPMHQMLNAIKVTDMLAEKPPLILTVRENDTVFTAISLMSSQNVGCVVVIDEFSDAPVGLFTERHYRERIVLKDRSSTTTKIKDVIDELPKHTAITPEFTLRECSSILVAEGLRHLPVTEFIGDALDEDSRITGIISSRDILKSLSFATDHCTDVVFSATMTAVYDYISRKHTSEFFLSPDDLVLTALELMSKHAINSVVVHNGTHIEGIFTERDYLHKVFLKNRRAPSTRLEEVMSTNIVFVSPSTPFMQGLKVMVDKNIRNLPIIPMELDDIEYSDRSNVLGLVTDIDMICYMLKRCNEMKE